MKLNYLMMGFTFLLVSSSTLAVSNDPCAVMLKQTAHTWACQKSSASDIENAIAQYGNCVDQGIQQLHTKMLKTQNYPLMGANSDFQDFSTALDNFTTLALNIKKDTILNAYTQLYKKQFKLIFYASYINYTKDPLIEKWNDTPKPNIKELKTYFDKTLLLYSPEQRNDLSAALQKMISESEFGKHHQEAIYVYALSILEPSSDGTFVSAPF